MQVINLAAIQQAYGSVMSDISYLIYTFFSKIGEFSNDMMRDVREEQNIRVD